MARPFDASTISDALAGNRAALARCVTVIERGGDDARTVGVAAYHQPQSAHVVGITGAPGAGKSTLTDRLIGQFRAAASTVAVVAVDPTSPFSGGAILGDRVRMQGHVLDADVFIRSMATRGHLGGLAETTPEVVRLLDAAGFHRVLIETVGVGQVEIEVASSADTTVVVVNPGWGDAVQANKAGLLEVADVFVINKADRAGVDDTRRDLEAMLDLSNPPDGWRPPVLAVTATEGLGVDAVVDAIDAHRGHALDHGLRDRRRRLRAQRHLEALVTRRLLQRMSQLSGPSGHDSVVEDVVAGRLDPWSAADFVTATL